MSALNGTFRSYFGAICVPILDKGDGTISNVTHDWANAAAGLGGGLAVTVLRLQLRNQRVDLAKERLAEMALQNNVDWLFFLDDDVVPPPDTIMKMVQLWRSDPKYKIISGVYWSKSDPPVPLIFRGNLQGSFWDWTTQDLIKADGAGAGCLFIDAGLLRKMPKPWFSCNYFFEDPRGIYDLKKWELHNRLGEELMRGKAEADPKVIKKLQDEMIDLAEQINKVKAGEFDPNLLKNRKNDFQTTEDLYFFRKAKELFGEEEGQLWIDCSIQCWHQDKRTGKIWGISPDMPQSKPRYEGRFKRGEKVVVDIGAGSSNYWIEEGKPIRVDIDPKTNPDVVADARTLPFENCFADVVFSSHTLEHFSFQETVSILKEWVRVLKIGGQFNLVVPNLKWASSRIMSNKFTNLEEAERAMFMFHSGQQGDLRNAYFDIHKAGFTPESLKGVLGRIPGLENIEVHTSDGNIGNWNDVDKLHTEDDLGYNIIAFAKKIKHDAAISLGLPFDMQEQAMYHIGDKALSDEEIAQDLKAEADKVLKKEDMKKTKKSKKLKQAIAETTDLKKRGRPKKTGFTEIGRKKSDVAVEIVDNPHIAENPNHEHKI